VVEAGDCAVCHTRPGGAYMAGGLPLVTPFGTLFTTNITPDPQSGIGQWSLDAFERAMREGIARDGHFLYPAFPYVHYRKLSDADIADAYAFLMSVDPIKYTAPENHMVFPMNFRPLVSFWNLLFLHGDPLEPLPNRSAQWNRGRYLVEGAGHCFVVPFAPESDWWGERQRTVQRWRRRRLDSSCPARNDRGTTPLE